MLKRIKKAFAQWLKPSIVSPVNLERFENILRQTGGGPENAKAIRATALTVGVDFTADEEAEAEIKKLSDEAEYNRKKAPEVEADAKRRADQLRKEADDVEKEGKRERRSLESIANSQEVRVEDLGNKISFLAA